MMFDRILVLDDDPERHAWYRRRYPGAVHVWRAEEALWHVQDPRGWDEITLDHDLDLSYQEEHLSYQEEHHSGLVVAEALAKSVEAVPWLRRCRLTIHSWNPRGARAMFDALEGAGLSPRYLPWRWEDDREWCRKWYRRAWPNPAERPALPWEV